MRNFLGFLFVLATFGFCNANEEDVIRARDLCYLQNYQAAAEGVNRLICQDESDPAGLFWQACLLQMLIYDSGNVGLLDSFYRTTDRVVALCRRRLMGSPDDARALVYWGLAELNRANCLSWQNRKLPAFMTILKVSSRLHRALELEPGLADAAFGLGVIEYFKATADRYLFGLGLIGSRERAYSLVQKAERAGVLMVPMAQFLLGFMMKEDKLYPGAIEWCEKLLARYPDNRAARRLLRDVYLDMGRFHQAIAVARGLERDIRQAFPNNRYGLAENWLKMAYAFEKLNETDSMVVYCERIIAWEGFQNQVPWLANYVREAKGLKERVRRSKS